jgi:hypothetical protein
MDPSKRGWSVADMLHRHGADSNQSRELFNTSSIDGSVPSSTQAQQRDAVTNNPLRRPPHQYTEPPKTPIRDFVEPSVPGAPSKFCRLPGDRGHRYSPIDLTEDITTDALFSDQFGSADAQLPAKKKRETESIFLQQALSGTQSWCLTPRKPKQVVKQVNPKRPAQLLEVAQEAEGVARRLQLPPLPQRRPKPRDPQDNDRRQQPKQILDPIRFIEELEITLADEPSDLVAEYAKLFKEAADPNIDTRDTEPVAAIIPTKKSRRRTRDEADPQTDPSPERKTRRRG